jgi:hypothetical protein
MDGDIQPEKYFVLRVKCSYALIDRNNVYILCKGMHEKFGV